MLFFSSPGDQRRDRLTQGSHRFKLSEGAGVLGVRSLQAEGVVTAGGLDILPWRLLGTGVGLNCPLSLAPEPLQLGKPSDPIQGRVHGSAVSPNS